MEQEHAQRRGEDSGDEQPDERLRALFGELKHQNTNQVGREYSKLDESRVRRREGLYIQHARQHRDIIQTKYLRDREKAHIKCMEEAEKAVNKFKLNAQGGKRQAELEMEQNVLRYGHGSGYQKSDLSDEMIFSESLAEQSNDRRDHLENALSQNPS